jgi:ABC-type branched-subunit amino acid transport system substrate-binding protein
MRKPSAMLRLLALLAALFMLVAACGRGDDDDDNGATDDTTADDDDGEPKELTNGPGFDGTTIKLGVLTPLSGPVAGVIGLPLTEGNRTFVKRINDEGGIAGKFKIELVEEDNQYNTDLTKTKYAQVKDQVVMFAQILGTPPTSAVLQDLKRDRIMASPASLDAEWMREEVLLPIDAPYQIQHINAAAHLVDEGSEGPFCFFGADDAYGEAGLEGIEFAAESLDFELEVTTRYSAAAGASTDYTAQITEMKNAKCAEVFVTALPTQANALLSKAGELQFEPENFVFQSPTYITAFSASPLWQKNVILTAGSGGVAWGDTSVPGMKQMLDDIAKYAPQQKPDIYFLFGYYQMQTVVALLEKAVENGDLSREGVIEASKELGVVEYDGLAGDYEYGEERQPPRATGLFKIVAKPETGGLELIEKVESDAAKEFEFE